MMGLRSPVFFVENCLLSSVGEAKKCGTPWYLLLISPHARTRTTDTLTHTFPLSCSNPPHQLVLVMVPFWPAPVQIRPTPVSHALIRTQASIPVCHALIHTHEHTGINTCVPRAHTYIQIQIQIRIHICAYT
jgi:hypothetical protein